MKRTVNAALFFITIGIIFGVTLVSNFNGIALSDAQSKSIKLGADRAPLSTNLDLRAANDAFVTVAKEATPPVVSIIVTTKVKKGKNMDEFFHFFPDFKFKHPDEQQSQGAGSGVIVSKDESVLYFTDKDSGQIYKIDLK